MALLMGEDDLFTTQGKALLRKAGDVLWKAKMGLPLSMFSLCSFALQTCTQQLTSHCNINSCMLSYKLPCLSHFLGLTGQELPKVQHEVCASSSLGLNGIDIFFYCDWKQCQPLPLVRALSMVVTSTLLGWANLLAFPPPLGV